MTIKRRHNPNVESILTPEVIKGLLAKEALLKAGVATPKGVIISSNEPQSYFLLTQCWSDSATEQELASFEITQSDACFTMLASESVLRREWDSPEEDEAWADL